MRNSRWLAVLSPVGFLLIWELASRSGALDPRFFPPPSVILQTLAAMTRSGELPYHVVVSGRRIVLGFLLGAVPAVAVGLAMGLERAYFNIARAYGARPLGIFTTIAFPGALPAIFTGLKLGMGFALIVIVGAELLGSDAGIGFLIWRSYQIFAVDAMFAGLLVTAVLGWLATAGLDWLEHRALPWRP